MPCSHGRPGLRGRVPAQPPMAALPGRTAGKTGSPGRWPSFPSPARHCVAGKCQKDLRDNSKTGRAWAADLQGGVTARRARTERQQLAGRDPLWRTCAWGAQGHPGELPLRCSQKATWTGLTSTSPMLFLSGRNHL